MTKKDYIKFAKFMSERKSDFKDHSMWLSFCSKFAELLEDDNPKFDENKFYKACQNEDD